MKKEVKTKVIMYLLKSISLLITNLNNLNNRFKRYIFNLDGWVKDINQKINILKSIEKELDDTDDNVQHNYELIYELKDQIEELKQEINALKLIQIISLKRERILKEHDKEVSINKTPT